jgi:uncharacterized protein
MKITISGGTGFIGSALADMLLADGHEITVLTRDPENARQHSKDIRFLSWDDVDTAISGSNAVVNLVGESLFGQRWTAESKKRIISSRIGTTSALVTAMAKADLDKRPQVFVSASAVGYYGDCRDRKVTESTPAGTDFLAEVCAKWEAASQKAPVGIRVVNPRIGIVLHPQGGALEKMITPFQFLLGGPLGSGTQFFPWIHRHDMLRILFECIKNESLVGPVNTASPNVVTMTEFTRTLGDVLNRPAIFKVPEFALSLLLGEAANAITSGQRIIPEVLQKTGFTWDFPDIKSALVDLLK